MQIFDSAEAELHKGINLIEASAGTGKTYAISMLVLRCVTELQIPIDQILIVTFTKAATEELKERIRIRIRVARDVLMGRVIPQDDDTLNRWANKVDDKELFVKLVEQALLDIDSASIHTIHSFCQRMLQEHSLESGQLFDVELVPDLSQTRLEVVYDFWRRQMYHLKPRYCAILTSRYNSPESLLESVGYSSLGDVRIEPDTPPFEEVLAAFDQAYEEMAAWFSANTHSLQAYFNSGVEENKFRPVFAGKFSRWWADIESYFFDKAEQLPDKIECLERQYLLGQLDGRRLRSEEKKKNFLADWPLPEKEIIAFNRAVEALVLGLRVDLFFQLHVEVDKRLRNLGAISFNDLIRQLSEALKGRKGRDFGASLAKRYQVGLIDEFQDTDLTQYHIFSTIFNTLNQYLYLIGDPKQAIYTFRGADIFSYFKARKAADHRLTLQKNYRSHPELIRCVNHLFSAHPNPFLFTELSYHSVESALKETQFYLKAAQQQQTSSTHLWQLDLNKEKKGGRWSSAKAADAICGAVIGEIETLLSTENGYCICKNGEEFSLSPKDIGVLVRTNSQAEHFRLAFSRAGIPAVVTGRQSVYESIECGQVLLLMQALCSPGDIQKLKTALSLDWFGFSGQELYRLFNDDDRFDSTINRFYAYSQQWHLQGFWSMMTSVLENETVFENLAESEIPERRLTNILHLMDLIQAVESREGYGPEQVFLWLKGMGQERQNMDETELRLESDKKAVKIVTMHSAKGLEYPVVFCPFLWFRSNRLNKETSLVSCHTKEQELVVDLGSSAFQERKERAIREQMAEELRLCYVALTRASLRSYILWADVQSYGLVDDSFNSALGYLLFSKNRVSFEEQQERLNQFCQRTESEYQLIEADRFSGANRLPSTRHAEGLYSAKQPSGRSLQQNWSMASYSALASLTIRQVDETRTDQVTTSAEGNDEQILELPIGPRFGNVIHALLETIPFDKLLLAEELSDSIKNECERYGVEADPGTMATFLHQIVTTPLVSPFFDKEQTGNPHLAILDENRVLKEMGFYFRLLKSTTSQINDILAEETLYSPLSHLEMEGYLTGYVDLIFQFNGRFYIADYKTNWLGDRLDDYGYDQMSDCIRSHNYGLQYWIYTLVLHRYLSRWYPGYQYEDHFGGVFYLFVRGMKKERQTNGVFYTKPDPAVLDQLGRCLGGADDR